VAASSGERGEITNAVVEATSPILDAGALVAVERGDRRVTHSA
jgi:hypothetical protein